MFLLIPAYPGSPGPTAVKRLCVCACVCVLYHGIFHILVSDDHFVVTINYVK